jgi:3-phenylpropionate/cinnamic acid dioxygenase small subunit
MLLDLSDAELKAKVEDVYAAYAECICDGRITEWPDFFVEECIYSVIQRINHDRKLPVGPMFAESRGALIDRVEAIQNAFVFSPRTLCYVTGGVRIVERNAGSLTSRSMFSAYHTLIDGETQLLMVARTFDRMVPMGDQLRFKERVVVFDTERIPGALIFPV